MMSFAPLLVANAEAFFLSPSVTRATTSHAISHAARMNDDCHEVELFSPASITLFNRILRFDAEEDALQGASLLQAIDYGDTLRVAKRIATDDEKSVEMEVSCVGDAAAEQLPMTPNTEAIVGALTLFNQKVAERAAASSSDGSEARATSFRVQLIKRVPVGLGLNDASSNAAAALHAANALCGYPASRKELMEWGAELGGAVASFLTDSGSVYCTGHGDGFHYDRVESVVPMAGLKAGTRYLPLYLILPDVSLSTTAVVQRLTEELRGGGIRGGATNRKGYAGRSEPDPQTLLVAMGAYEGRWLTPALAETLPPDGQLFLNDLQPYALDESSQLAAVQAALLEHGGLKAVLTGAGPAMHAFGALSEAAAPGGGDREPAERFARQLSAKVTAASGVRVRVIHAGFCSPPDEGFAAEARSWYVGPEFSRDGDL